MMLLAGAPTGEDRLDSADGVDLSVAKWIMREQQGVPANAKRLDALGLLADPSDAEFTTLKQAMVSRAVDGGREPWRTNWKRLRGLA